MFTITNVVVCGTFENFDQKDWEKLRAPIKADIANANFKKDEGSKFMYFGNSDPRYTLGGENYYFTTRLRMFVVRCKASVMVYPSAKVVCVGAKSVKDAFTAVNVAYNEARKTLKDLKKGQFRVANIIAAFDIYDTGIQPPLRKGGDRSFALSYYQKAYAYYHNKETTADDDALDKLDSSLLTYRMVQPKIVIRMSTNGKCTLLGAKTVADVETTIRKFHYINQQVDLKKSTRDSDLQVDENGVVTNVAERQRENDAARDAADAERNRAAAEKQRHDEERRDRSDFRRNRLQALSNETRRASKSSSLNSVSRGNNNNGRINSISRANSINSRASSAGRGRGRGRTSATSNGGGRGAGRSNNPSRGFSALLSDSGSGKGAGKSGNASRGFSALLSDSGTSVPRASRGERSESASALLGQFDDDNRLWEEDYDGRVNKSTSGLRRGGRNASSGSRTTAPGGRQSRNASVPSGSTSASGLLRQFDRDNELWEDDYDTALRPPGDKKDDAALRRSGTNCRGTLSNASKSTSGLRRGGMSASGGSRISAPRGKQARDASLPSGSTSASGLLRQFDRDNELWEDDYDTALRPFKGAMMSASGDLGGRGASSARRGGRQASGESRSSVNRGKQQRSVSAPSGSTSLSGQLRKLDEDNRLFEDDYDRAMRPLEDESLSSTKKKGAPKRRQVPSASSGSVSKKIRTAS